MARLFLVDGMSHLYRAYFAIKGLTNRDGLSTNAVYGFTTMLRKLIADEAPDYLGVAIDLDGATVRHEVYQDYKATRAKMPDDLREQVPYAWRVCEAMRIPVLSQEGYEADDVIGTLTRKASEQGLDVVIVTIDKDLFQLVSDRVSVLDTRSQTLYTPEEVEKKWGVRPERVIDVLSLIGDTSDNIPGAPGIGEKGAKGLIEEYGSLDHLLEQAEKVSRKSYRESLQNHAEQILKSRELLRIYEELPIELDLKQLELKEPDNSALRTVFEELGFSSLLQEIPSEKEPFDPHVETLRSVSDLEELIDDLKGKRLGLAVWFEGDDPLDGGIEALALALDGRSARYLPGRLLASEEESVRRLVAAPAQWVVHDLKPWRLATVEGPLRGLPGDCLDTMLMAYLIDPNERDFSLDRLTEQSLGIGLGEARGSSLLGEDRPADLGRRAAATLLLTEALESEIQAKGLQRVLESIEIPLVSVLADMEAHGVLVDTSLLAQLSQELAGEIDELTVAIYGLAGEEFNLNSPKQLSYVMFEKLNLPQAGKTGKAGHYSTGVEVLEELAVSYEIAEKILDYRELAKLKNTYLDALPKLLNPRTGRIHTSYNQMVAATGRLSSSNPNLQNIPVRTEQGRKIRRAFIPASGFKILAADYSQIELRLMAHFSRDPVLVEAFRAGEDIHERTAREVFGDDSGVDAREQRRRAKVINFGILYGLSAFGLARGLKIDRAEAQRFIDSYFARYKGVREWIEKTVEGARRDGYVTTLYGRIRPIPEINSKNWNLREFAKRTAVNAPIQGTAADLIKLAMIAIDRRIHEDGLRSRLILQVHDELVFEAAVDEVEGLKQMVCEEMEAVAELEVPLQVEAAVGDNWYEAK